MNVFVRQKPQAKSELLGALDIGTSKICCAIGQQNANATSDGYALKILGVGYQLSRGLRSGHIVDMEALEDSILNAVHAAEQTALKNVNSVYVSVPSKWLQSQRIRVEISLSNTIPIDESHIKRLLNLNKDLTADLERKVLHIIPLSYEVDHMKGIIDPRGMVGHTLAVILHLISAPSSLLSNLGNCIGRCHLDVAGYVAAPYASGLSTLVADEMQLGVTLIDIGAGQTSLSTFVDHHLTSTTTIPIGGVNITNDIARGLAIPLTQAERLKTLYGSLLSSPNDEKENVLISQIGETIHAQRHHIPKGFLVHIIKARVEELFELISQKVLQNEIDPVAFQCLVLTGGVSQLQGIKETAQSYFKTQVRLATPSSQLIGTDYAQNPSFSTCAGLLHYACQDRKNQTLSEFSTHERGLFKKVKHWLKVNF